MQILTPVQSDATTMVRSVGVGSLIGVLSLLVLSFYLPRTQAQEMRQNARPTAVKQRQLNKTDWPRLPVKVTNANLKKGPVVFGEPFADADDDWLEGFTLKVENTSNKTIVFIDVSLTFFDKDEGLVPSTVPLSFPLSYGSGSGVFESSSPFHPIKPGESVDITFTADHLHTLKTLLVENDYPLSFRYVDVRIDNVVFADGQMWYKSYLFYRDPNNPNRFIRDRASKPGPN